MAKINDPTNLTYSVDGATGNLRFDTANKTIELVEGTGFTFLDGVTGQCLYSKIKEVIKDDANLIKYKLPVNEMIHDESLELIHGWTFKNTNTLKAVRDCGVAYVAENGTITAMYACIVTLGSIVTGAPYFVQDTSASASTATFTHVNLGTTFGVNELIQIYSDPNADGSVADGYDRRTYFKVFLRVAGYTFDERSNSDIGYPVLTYKKYNYPATHTTDVGVTQLDGVVSLYTGMSITWGATTGVYLLTNGPYSYGVTVNANGHTADETYSWIQYKLRQGTDIDDGGGNRTGQVAAALVYMDGTTLKTKYQAGIGGLHVSSISAGSYNDISEVDNSQVYHGYPRSVEVLCEFDSFLLADTASKFWVFPTSTYGTGAATPVLDALGNPMTDVATINKSYGYIHAGDLAVTGVALGTSGAKVAIATGIITTSGVKLVFVGGQERWYSNP